MGRAKKRLGHTRVMVYSLLMVGGVLLTIRSLIEFPHQVRGPEVTPRPQQTFSVSKTLESGLGLGAGTTKLQGYGFISCGGLSHSEVLFPLSRDDSILSLVEQ